MASRALCIDPYGNGRDSIDHSCHQRTYAVLQAAGVKHILANSTIGSLNRAIQVGDQVINADIVELTQSPYSLSPGRMRFDCSGKQIVCPVCAKIAAEVARRLWPAAGRFHGVELGLVAAHVYGPRLTAPAEVMAFRSMGAEFINHSIAAEVTLAREIGACFVPVAFVTAGFTSTSALLVNASCGWERWKSWAQSQAASPLRQLHAHPTRRTVCAKIRSRRSRQSATVFGKRVGAPIWTPDRCYQVVIFGDHRLCTRSALAVRPMPGPRLHCQLERTARVCCLDRPIWHDFPEATHLAPADHPAAMPTAPTKCL